MEVQDNHGSGGSVTGLRLRLVRQGYLLVSVSAPWVKPGSAGKRPLMDGWPVLCAAADEATIRSWERSQRNCTNTDILSNTCRGVDVDDRDLSQQLLALAFAHFGPTPLIRIGQDPQSWVFASNQPQNAKGVE